MLEQDRPAEFVEVERFINEFNGVTNDLSCLVSAIETSVARFSGDWRPPEEPKPQVPNPTEQFFRMKRQLDVAREVVERLESLDKIMKKYF